MDSRTWNSGAAYRNNPISFPAGFFWGASTSAQQIEGAVNEGGRGTSVWDMFCRRPDAVYKSANADVACDHYHRMESDVALLSSLGANAYRFSVAWPRIQPDGFGPANSAGLDFYDRLVDQLLSHGITPFLTLYHWDMPYELALRGGWMNPDSPHWFHDYAALVTERLGDRVKWWMTFNEQAPFLVGGYLEGWHAPGFKAGWSEFLRAAKNVMLAHGDAIRVMRELAPDAKLGMAPVGMAAIPTDERPESIEAARRQTFELFIKTHWHQALYIDPVLRGALAANFGDIFGHDAPEFSEADLSRMSPRLDFLGINFYNAPIVESGSDGPKEVPAAPGFPPHGDYWGVTPEGIYWCTKFYHERYGLPVVITENGMACQDWIALDGKVHDTPRIDALRRYLMALNRAIAEGVPVLGYLHWSLMDNFEWAEGYKQRFGLIHVDFQTLERTIKESGKWFRRVAQSNGRVGISEWPVE